MEERLILKNIPEDLVEWISSALQEIDAVALTEGCFGQKN